MNFLQQLKDQASTLQSAQAGQTRSLEALLIATEGACKTINTYVMELAQQLHVIEPRLAHRISLDGKNHWPEMKAADHRADARRMRLHNREVFQYITMTWRIVPCCGAPVAMVAEANFPPDQQRVESRLMTGSIAHERKELRHPDNGRLLAYRYEHRSEALGALTVKPDHARGRVHFRLTNAHGLGVHSVEYGAAEVNHTLLDELARLLAGQPGHFV